MLGRERLEWEVASRKIGVVVLDADPPAKPQCAAMLVPQGRELDWIFSSKAGQEQLLASSGVATLILLSRGGLGSEEQAPALDEWELDEEEDEDEELKKFLGPFLLQLVRNKAGLDEIQEVPFACYQDNVVWSRVLERAYSRKTGMMLVEDVRLEGGHLRRRLRFKSLPNLIQTEVPLLGGDLDLGLDRTDSPSACSIDHGVLVHAYLAPLVAGFSLISRCLESCSAAGDPAGVLCVGIGGGALPMRRFGLVPAENLRVHVEDGVETVRNIARSRLEDGGGAEKEKVAEHFFHAIVVDVSDGSSRSCPPEEFAEGEFLRDARSALDSGGMLAMNVMPLGEESHRGLLKRIGEVFDEVYQLEVSSGDNFAVFALKNPLRGVSVPLTCKIGNLVGSELLNNIFKVETYISCGKKAWDRKRSFLARRIKICSGLYS
ncbi:methyltransferase-like protein 13 [Selaginella moellendorffii]|uniref:methyltransferase-like protein 13 n=1 Tax=Selaginella moellendorffii TaxID=88036 RepID=UPI000D1C8CB8|nr:methyltransferase-like protein 13 [Selaginella moellendorffii]|eukprot:XP_024536101.1 methyltransferase-like protein 13 [Selaginella moellendorffii]